MKVSDSHRNTRRSSYPCSAYSSASQLNRMISNDKSRFLPTAYDRQSVTSYQEALNEIRENREQTNFDNINDIPRHRNHIQIHHMIWFMCAGTVIRRPSITKFLNCSKSTG